MNNLKIGVLGAGRGMFLATDFMLNGCDIVAVCDSHPDRLEAAVKKFGNDLAVYTDFDEFLNHDLDAVLLANFFHEHAPYAIKCFKKGIHVLSECTSNGTMAEGVELIREYEKSDSIYMILENYPHMKFNKEIKRICDSGTLGKILYAEGEYNHPGNPYDAEFKKVYCYHRKHWRNFIPRSYYITHSLAPVMHATGATPVKLTAFNVFAPISGNAPSASYVGDKAAIITTKNNDGSVFRITGCAGFGSHHNSCRVCGTEGQIENVRGNDETVILRYNEWSMPENAEKFSMYVPEWNDKDEDIIKKSGHGGGDFLAIRMFVDCVKNKKEPVHPFDIHSAVTMASVGILAHRSMLEGGKVYEIPDYHKEEWRKKYENDYLTPIPRSDGREPDMPCCSVQDYKPTEKQLELNDELLKTPDLKIIPEKTP